MSKKMIILTLVLSILSLIISVKIKIDVDKELDYLTERLNEVFIRTVIQEESINQLDSIMYRQKFDGDLIID